MAPGYRARDLDVLHLSVCSMAQLVCESSSLEKISATELNLFRFQHFAFSNYSLSLTLGKKWIPYVFNMPNLSLN